MTPALPELSPHRPRAARVKPAANAPAAAAVPDNICLRDNILYSRFLLAKTSRLDRLGNISERVSAFQICATESSR